MQDTNQNNPARRKWNQQYAGKSGKPEACTVLSEHQYLLPQSGTSLDIACGPGGNALLLASLGLQSHACDISSVALEQLRDYAAEQGLAVQTMECDLESGATAFDCLQPACYDVIVASQYLYRPLCPFISRALKPGGLLFYQTFTANKPDNVGPSNPAFLLQRNELLSLFGDLQLVYYREDDQAGDAVAFNAESVARRNLAYFIGQKTAE